MESLVNQENNIYDEKYTGNLAPLLEHLEEKGVDISSLSTYNTEDLIYFLIDSDHITPQFGIVVAEITDNSTLLSTLLDRHKLLNETMINLCETCSVRNLAIILGYYFRRRITRSSSLFFWKICDSGSIAKVSLVLSYDSDNLRSKLLDAVSSGKLNIVQHLIDFGAECHRQAFVLACESNHIDIVQYFISIGAIYPEAGIESVIPQGNFEITKILYLYASQSIKSKNHYMYLASTCGYINIALWFMCNGADVYDNCMSNFAQYGTFEDVNALIAMGAENLGGALQGACKGNKLGTVIQLLKIGAGDDINSLKESFGWVCYYDNVEILQYLTDEGYATHDFLDYGMSDACIKVSYDSIQLLLTMGVSIEESYIVSNISNYTLQQFITLSELVTTVDIDINLCLTMLCGDMCHSGVSPIYDYLLKKGARCNNCFGDELSCGSRTQFI